VIRDNRDGGKVMALYTSEAIALQHCRLENARNITAGSPYCVRVLQVSDEVPANLLSREGTLPEK
jgi:hypothetical protein